MPDTSQRDATAARVARAPWPAALSITSTVATADTRATAPCFRPSAPRCFRASVLLRHHCSALHPVVCKAVAKWLRSGGVSRRGDGRRAGQAWSLGSGHEKRIVGNFCQHHATCCLGQTLRAAGRGRRRAPAGPATCRPAQLLRTAVSRTGRNSFFVTCPPAPASLRTAIRRASARASTAASASSLSGFERNSSMPDLDQTLHVFQW